jgi:hypothetical protein
MRFRIFFELTRPVGVLRDGAQDEQVSIQPSAPYALPHPASPLRARERRISACTRILTTHLAIESGFEGRSTDAASMVRKGESSGRFVVSLSACLCMSSLIRERGVLRASGRARMQARPCFLLSRVARSHRHASVSTRQDETGAQVGIGFAVADSSGFAAGLRAWCERVISENGCLRHSRRHPSPPRPRCRVVLSPKSSPTCCCRRTLVVWLLHAQTRQ